VDVDRSLSFITVYPLGTRHVQDDEDDSYALDGEREELFDHSDSVVEVVESAESEL
jgi:hypothetical protein